MLPEVVEERARCLQIVRDFSRRLGFETLEEVLGKAILSGLEPESAVTAAIEEIFG